MRKRPEEGETAETLSESVGRWHNATGDMMIEDWGSSKVWSRDNAFYVS